MTGNTDDLGFDSASPMRELNFLSTEVGSAVGLMKDILNKSSRSSWCSFLDADEGTGKVSWISHFLEEDYIES